MIDFMLVRGVVEWPKGRFTALFLMRWGGTWLEILGFKGCRLGLGKLPWRLNGCLGTGCPGV